MLEWKAQIFMLMHHVLFYTRMTFIGHGVRQGMQRATSEQICTPIIPDS